MADRRRAGASTSRGLFRQYYRDDGDRRAEPGAPFTSPDRGAWTEPGPAAGPFTALLVDGSRVTYRWYRFVDQPSFQQYKWSPKIRRLQQFVERLHREWPTDRDYLPPPLQAGCRAAPLFVTPPKCMEAGYVRS
ncbi:MAG: hypothetical protein IPK67_00675 [Planctomycetes bacterium]|nr:hypothetical protein [Planctomycetota bacterium]